jgi:hypothetical protein
LTEDQIQIFHRDQRDNNVVQDLRVEVAMQNGMDTGVDDGQYSAELISNTDDELPRRNPS